MMVFLLRLFVMYLLVRAVRCTSHNPTVNQMPSLHPFIDALEDPDQDINELALFFAAMLNDNISLHIKIASNGNVFMKTLYPLLLRYYKHHQNFRGFPNVSLPPDYHYESHHLSIQFYQTLASAPTDPSILRKLNALKIIDFCSGRNQLIAVSQSEIDKLHHLQTPNSVECDTAFGMIYDPKYYESNGQYWCTIKRFQSKFGAKCQALSDVLKRNVALKLDLAKCPELTKTIIFPMIMHYHSTHSDLSGFPEFGLPADIDQDYRSLMFFDILTSCASDLHFIEKLYAIKIIDHFQNGTQKELDGVSFEDITKLAVCRGLIMMNEEVIIDTIYDPLYYRTKESFLTFIGYVHYLYSSEMQSAGDLMVWWKTAIRRWFQPKTQQNVMHAVGSQELHRMNMGLMNTNRGRIALKPIKSVSFSKNNTHYVYGTSSLKSMKNVTRS